MSIAETSNLNLVIRKGIFKLAEKEPWTILFMAFYIEWKYSCFTDVRQESSPPPALLCGHEAPRGVL